MVGVVSQKVRVGICASWLIWPAAIEGSASQGVIITFTPLATSSCAACTVAAVSLRVLDVEDDLVLAAKTAR
jgi:hypothetical protein